MGIRGNLRRDSKHRVLRAGESIRADGKYQFKYHVNGKPKFVYSWKLEPTDKLPAGKKPCLSLRELEKQIGYDLDSQMNIMQRNLTVMDLVERYLWQGEEQKLHLVPCVDENVRACFYNTISESTYLNNGFGKFSYEDEGLVFDTESYLEEIPINRLSASAFRQYGFDDFPRDVIISRLVNPTLYYWQDADIDLPPISAKISATPPVQLVYSKNTEMNTSTILGIESVEIDSDDNTLFAFSFDSGSTWKAYTDGRWMTLSEETSGMNRESVKVVGTYAWNEAAADRQYKIRFALREGGYVNRITAHYLN